MKQDSKQIRRFQSKFTAWQLRSAQKVDLSEPRKVDLPAQLQVLVKITHLTVLQPGGMSFLVRFFGV